PSKFAVKIEAIIWLGRQTPGLVSGHFIRVYTISDPSLLNDGLPNVRPFATLLASRTRPEPSAFIARRLLPSVMIERPKSGGAGAKKFAVAIPFKPTETCCEENK